MRHASQAVAKDTLGVWMLNGRLAEKVICKIYRIHLFPISVYQKIKKLRKEKPRTPLRYNAGLKGLGIILKSLKNYPNSSVPRILPQNPHESLSDLKENYPSIN